MGKKLRRIAVIMMMLFVVFGLAGCATDIDGNHDGFSSGFNYIAMTNEYSSIDCAARSEKTEFDIDDVTLDFYFGWRTKDDFDSSENTFIGLYFGVPRPNVSMRFFNEVDYRSHEGLYHLADIPSHDFFSDDYAINMTKKEGKVFGESVRFTVPEEIFKERNNFFDFIVFSITYSEEEKVYYGSAYALMNIKCEYIDDNTVRLIQSYHK